MMVMHDMAGFGTVGEGGLRRYQQRTQKQQARTYGRKTGYLFLEVILREGARAREDEARRFISSKNQVIKLWKPAPGAPAPAG